MTHGNDLSQRACSTNGLPRPSRSPRLAGADQGASLPTFRLHFLQHVSFEEPGFLLPWAQDRGLLVSSTRFYVGDPLPPLDGVDAVIVLGGPMSVHDEATHPWLVTEKQFLRAVVAKRIPVLGICLGAQLLAQLLGARVYANAEQEIGWFPVRLTPAARMLPALAGIPDELTVLHWHGETFDAVPDALHLATSTACVQQAFVYGNRVVGLQFHLEITAPGVVAMIQHGGAGLTPAAYVQGTEELLQQKYFSQGHYLLSQVMDWLLTMLTDQHEFDLNDGCIHSA